ncbi:MAG: hypothetical protein HUJ99_07515, partial [Bacteroidaceae bacterium]|nr:hypothetical protein [Bacteroidaceae bacterium]
MKKVLFLMAALLTVPLGVNAQDDMYFSSSKQSKKDKNKSAYQAPSASKATDGAKYRTYDDDDVIYNGNGIEDGKETLPNDTLYIDPNETFSDGDGEFVGGLHGSVDDYLHTKRVISWANMSTAIPVGSSLYWNLVYGPNAFDWNVYRVGGIAYVTPTWCNPLYSSFRYNVAWGMTNWFNPWRHNWAGWGWGGFYDPWDPWDP